MKIIIILILLNIHLVLNSEETKSELYEGKLVFTVIPTGFYNVWEFEVLFNKENIKIFEKYSLNTSKTLVYNKNNNDILRLYKERTLNSDKTTDFFNFCSQEELIFDANHNNNQDTIIIETSETKDILGYECYKTIIKRGKQVEYELWVTDKIKLGLVYPWTPLHFENIALEFEERVLGESRRKYKIKSISNTQIPIEEFSQNIPDDYFLIIPISYFSDDETNIKDEFKDIDSNISYPFFKENRIKTINYLNEGINSIIPTDKVDKYILSIDFIVNIDGTVSDIINNSSIKSKNNDDLDILIDDLNSFILNMNNWTPAKVKNIPVKARVSIFKMYNAIQVSE